MFKRGEVDGGVESCGEGGEEDLNSGDEYVLNEEKK